MSTQNTTGGPSIISNFEESFQDIYNKLANLFKTKKEEAKHYLEGIRAKAKPLNLYLQRNFQELSKTDLKQPLDEDGDTIIHLMAYVGDKQGFEEIKKYNPQALTYDVINAPNKKGQLPIHMALEGIKERGGDDKSFIDYMVKILGANPNVPDIKNRVVAKKNVQTSSEEKSRKQLKQLNDDIINNINNLTKLVGKGDEKGVCMIHQGSKPSTSENPDLDFIIKLTKFYEEKSPKNSSQKGGYNGKRRIKNYISDLDLTETGRYDSFVSRRRNQMINDRTSSTRGTNLRDFDNTETSPFEDNDIGRPEDSLTSEDIESREFEDIRDVTSEFDSDLMGGRTRRNSNGQNMSESSRRARRFNDEWRTDEFELSTTTEKRNRRSNDDDDDEIVYSDAFDFGDEEIESQSRPQRRRRRDPKVNEVYKSFIRTIMDSLGVDEETARLYRSAIKYTIEKENPELRRWENDALKVKEIEKIVEDKQALQDMIDRIDFDEYRKFAAERKELSEARQKEWEERRAARRKERGETQAQDTETTSTNDQTTTSEETPARKPKRTRKTSRVTESGYLQSDEIIVSPYY